MSGTIGWHVHHDGEGHLARARAVAAHLDDVTLFRSWPGPDVFCLPVDAATPAATRHRLAILSTWTALHDPVRFVIDESEEVTTLMRMLQVPTTVVRRRGTRPRGHQVDQMLGASTLLATFPSWLESPTTHPAVVERTVYAGGLSRHDGRRHDRARARDRLMIDEDDALVVVYAGHGMGLGWDVVGAAASTPGWRWAVLGTGWGPRVQHSRTITGLGWVEDPGDWLVAADVVVTHAGSTVMDVASVGRPMLVVPRLGGGHDELIDAGLLEDTGVATVRPVWPAGPVWADLLDTVVVSSTARASRMCDGQGARRAAAHLAGIDVERQAEVDLRGESLS